jgi:CBS domain containing-hemolysin-like protein
MSEHHQTLTELANQAISNPKAASAVAAYSTAAGTIGLLAEVKDWLSVVSLLFGIILSSIMIVIHGRKLYKDLKDK